MLPPSPMLAQINSVRGVFVVLALALLLSGCTPAGPRALLKGKKCLDRGEVAEAVTQFRRATALLATNASAWNYLGVALQRAGQPDDAASAYQTALRLDRDLVEAHFNLGVLSLEQNRPDLAKAELTAYTLRRPNDAAGWLKLGFAQLRAGDLLPSERSFSTMLSLKTDEAEAYNGLGLARLQSGKYREAAQFFAAAVQARPDFGPALENLATVNLQYLHDNKAALASYQACLSLNPRPANYNEIKGLVAGLVQSDAAATVMAPAVMIKTSPPPSELKPKVAFTAPAPRPAPVERTEPVEIPATHAPPRTTVVATPAFPTTTPLPTQTVHGRPEPTVAVSPKTNRPSHPMAATTVKPAVTNTIGAQAPLEAPMPEEEQPRPGFWHRLFKGDKPSPPSSAKRFHEENSEPASEPDSASASESVSTPAPAPTPTSTPVPAPASTSTPAPVPAANDEIAGTKPEAKAAEPKVQPAPVIPRYAYAAPAKPAPGDRQSAEGGFTKARMAEQDENWVDAEQWYQMAADTDPSWFEAQYNTGVIAHRLHNYSAALPRYELALAIQPDSVDARYNFALALKASGYSLDAAEELRKILAVSPDEVRAHLALANLCAQSLHEPAQARRHYLRVLDLEPDNPQAADIRFWLSANTGATKSE
jgi:tetratricopeptide (TPR) repeat protein